MNNPKTRKIEQTNSAKTVKTNVTLDPNPKKSKNSIFPPFNKCLKFWKTVRKHSETYKQSYDENYDVKN